MIRNSCSFLMLTIIFTVIIMSLSSQLVFGSKTRIIDKTLILFSSLVDSQYKHTGYYSEALHYILPLLEYDGIEMVVDRNCNGWSHIGGCEKASDRIQRLINDISVGESAFNEILTKYDQFVLIRHLPLNWFDIERTDHSFEDSYILQDQFVYQLANNSYHYMEIKDNIMKKFFRIARTMYESDSIPSNWVEKLNKMDYVWVPSQFNKETFHKSGVHLEKIRVIPEAIDTDYWQMSDSIPRFKVNSSFVKDDAIVFLSVFKWESRKGPEILLSSFMNEFSNSDNVCLLLKLDFSLSDTNSIKIVDGVPISHESNAQFLQFIFKSIALEKKRTKNPKLVLERHQYLPCIIPFSSYMEYEDMRSLFARADIYISTSKGEGWGLPTIQAMSMGKLVIAPKFGGSTEYMNAQNSLLIDIDYMEPSSQLYGSVAVPDILHTRKLLRQSFKQYYNAEMKKLANNARSTVVSKYQPRQVVATMVEEIEKIAKQQ